MAVTDDVWGARETEISPKELEHALEKAGADQVVCRECAQTFGQITAQHLGCHGMSLDEYKAEHPDAPIYPEAESRQPGRDRGFTHTKETKQKIGESVKRNHDGGAYE